MSEHETWPPIRGTGWIRGGRPVQRRTGDVAIDSMIQNLIEGAAASPVNKAEYLRQAWSLYDAHGRIGKRFVRELRVFVSNMASVLVWLVVGAALVIVSAYVWR